MSQSTSTHARMKLVLLIALFVVPVLASWMLFFHVMKDGEAWATSNKGVLIRPMVALQDFDLKLTQGATLSLKDIETRWTLLYFMPRICDERCKKDIYHMRQVHVSVHKDFERLQRLVILQKPEQLQSEYAFLQHYQDTLIALQDDSQRALGEQITMPYDERLTNSTLGHVFIVDPQAHVIMVYEQGVNPEKMFRDLKKLLRISRIG